MKTIRKITLQVGAVALLSLVACNAYLAVRSLGQIRSVIDLSLESSMIQTNVSEVLRHLINLETGQRGYLLTAETSYLQPYTDAKDRIAADFARLRTGLEHRTEHERSLELQLEAFASSMQAEMEHTITLRQKGYRRRAFKVVDSGEGKEWMDKAREVLSRLAADEESIAAGLRRQRAVTVSNAQATIIIANSGLLVITGCLFWLARYHWQGLEKQAARSRNELAARDLQLQKLTSTLSTQARFKTSAIETNASLLLQEYGGFLPRVGHECAEQIKEAAAQIEQLRQDLVGGLNHSSEESVYDSVA